MNMFCSDFRNMRRGDFVQYGGMVRIIHHSQLDNHNDDSLDIRFSSMMCWSGMSRDVGFQLLSAQRANDTAGVGVAGTGEAAYNATDQQIQARLYSIGRWYRYREGDTSDDYKIIPEMYVGRFKRPFSFLSHVFYMMISCSIVRAGFSPTISTWKRQRTGSNAYLVTLRF
ncbi:MAG: hypothetical protein IPL59_19520 [Candidatus Competibacteraceae bacterium]|nr:hypothetical protein [Candidatus Competibacteraceae bacterium]